MKIGVNSWHYRLNNAWVDNWEGRLPKSLCAYFWRTVWTLLHVLFVVAFCAFALFVLASAVWWLFSLHGLELRIAMLVIAGLACLTGWIATGVWLAQEESRRDAAAMSAFWEARRKWLEGGCVGPEPVNPRHRPKPPPGLLVSFLKAKKQKVCPPIEYVDGSLAESLNQP